jgi:hypothetical protein
MPDDSSIGSGSDGGYGGTGGGFGGGDASFGGGLSGGALGIDNAMSFSGADALAIAGVAAIGIGAYAGVAGLTGATIGVGGALAVSASNPLSALADLAQSMSAGLGVAVTANPSIDLMASTGEPIDLGGGGSGSIDPSTGQPYGVAFYSPNDWVSAGGG